MYERYTIFIIVTSIITLIIAIGFALLIAWIIIKIIKNQPIPDSEITWAENIGIAGENKIEVTLRKLSGNYYIMRNLYIPCKDHKTEIDLLMLHEKGIFVFESKNFNGWIFGSEKTKYWMQTFKHSRHKFYNPIHQNEVHIKALSELLHLKENEKPTSYIVFGNTAELKKMPRTDKCTICQQLGLLGIMNEDLKNREIIYDNQILSVYCNYLKQYTNAENEIKNEHKKYIDKLN